MKLRRRRILVVLDLACIVREEGDVTGTPPSSLQSMLSITSCFSLGFFGRSAFYYLHRSIYSVLVLCHMSAFDGGFLKHFETMIRSELRSARWAWRSRRIEEYEDVEKESYARGDSRDHNRERT